MEAFAFSAVTVALAEIGDKTQLLSLFLAARFRNHTAIIAGILLATILNHAASAFLGEWLMNWIPAGAGRWLVGISFIAIGLWVLIPDKDDDKPSMLERYGAFVATTILFFLAEIGDKTQIATVVLAAQYQSLFWVTAGTTLGMLVANVPVVLLGEKLMQRLPMHYTRVAACIVFILLGILAIVL